MFLKNTLDSKPRKIGPPGCTPLRDEDRMPVVKVVSGDTWTISAELTAADGGPASPGNSYVEFCLSENQFSPPLWTGEWVNGVLPDQNRPGLVHVNIPQETTKTLRRGSYMFSLRVADRTKFYFDTQLVGNFLVEYMPTSDHRSIPYRDGTSEIFGVDGGESAKDEDISTEQLAKILARVIDQLKVMGKDLESVSEEGKELSRLIKDKVDYNDFRTFDNLNLQDDATQREIRRMLQSVLAKLKDIKGDA